MTMMPKLVDRNVALAKSFLRGEKMAVLALQRDMTYPAVQRSCSDVISGALGYKPREAREWLREPAKLADAMDRIDRWAVKAKKAVLRG